MKINPRPRLSSYTAAAGYPAQHACVQHLFSAIIGSHNTAFKEAGWLFQGFLDLRLRKFHQQRSKKRNKKHVSLSSWTDPLSWGKSSPTSETDTGIYSAFTYKRVPSGWQLEGDTFRGTFLGFSPPRSFSCSGQPGPFVLRSEHGKHQKLTDFSCRTNSAKDVTTVSALSTAAWALQRSPGQGESSYLLYICFH